MTISCSPPFLLVFFLATVLISSLVVILTMPTQNNSSPDTDLDQVLKEVDIHEEEWINLLGESVAFKSVSAWPDTRDECILAMKWFADLLLKEGVDVEMADPGNQTFPDGREIPLPPVILGSIGNDPSKKTVLIYGHLDVQPALIEDGWSVEPFKMIEKEGKLYGRGANDDKGPVIAWLVVLQVIKRLKLDLPVNLKFCFEGMEESGSEGLDPIVFARKDTFFKGIDYVVISDNWWVGKNKPSVSYGLRGLAYFFIEVESSTKDLHSGVFGGTIHEAMSDLMFLMNSLLDADGNILIPGIMNDVAPLTPEEEARYETIDFSEEDYKGWAGVEHLRRAVEGNKKKTLMSRWRYPSLSLHGIQGSFDGDGAKTVIPRKVTGKFSLRIVPNHTPEKVEKLVVKYLEELFATRNSPNKLRVILFHGGKPYIADPTGPNFKAGVAAVKRVYGVEPDFAREGGTIPVALTFQDVTGQDVILIAMGTPDDGAHSQDEKLDRDKFIKGIKVFASYLYECSKL